MKPYVGIHKLSDVNYDKMDKKHCKCKKSRKRMGMSKTLKSFKTALRFEFKCQNVID